MNLVVFNKGDTFSCQQDKLFCFHYLGIWYFSTLLSKEQQFQARRQRDVQVVLTLLLLSNNLHFHSKEGQLNSSLSIFIAQFGFSGSSFMMLANFTPSCRHPEVLYLYVQLHRCVIFLQFIATFWHVTQQTNPLLKKFPFYQENCVILSFPARAVSHNFHKVDDCRLDLTIS